jgi:hypothetical protein
MSNRCTRQLCGNKSAGFEGKAGIILRSNQVTSLNFPLEVLNEHGPSQKIESPVRGHTFAILMFLLSTDGRHENMS